MTYNGDTGFIAIYKDNALLASTTDATPNNIDWTSITALFIGGSASDDNWAGTMDDFAIWDEELDAETRTAIYTNGVASIPEPSSTALLSLAGLTLALRRRR